MLEIHEEVALIATIVLGAYGVLALFSLLAFRHGVTMRFTRILLILSFLPLVAMTYTAYLGGQIRHSEIRPEAGDATGGSLPFSPGPSIALTASEEGWIAGRDTVDLIPPSIREEHESLRRALAQATREPAKVGEAAWALAALMEPHFVKEEELALPPLGVLPTVAAGETIPDSARIMSLATRLEAELGEHILHHARSEEEITYPAAIIVGRYLQSHPR